MELVYHTQRVNSVQLVQITARMVFVVSSVYISNYNKRLKNLDVECEYTND